MTRTRVVSIVFSFIHLNYFTVISFILNLQEMLPGADVNATLSILDHCSTYTIPNPSRYY